MKFIGINFKKITAFFIFGTIFLLSGFSATITWIGGSTGDWNVTSNWDLGRVPNNLDDLKFNSDVTIISATQLNFKSITSTGNLTLECNIYISKSATIDVPGDLVLGTSSNTFKVFSSSSGSTGVILTATAKTVTVNGSFENVQKNSTFEVADTVEQLVLNGNIGGTNTGSKINLKTKAATNIFNNSLLAGTTCTITNDVYFTNGIEVKFTDFTCNGNVFVDIPEDQEFKLNFLSSKDMNVNGSFVLTSGILTIEKIKNITIGNDLVLLGKGSAGAYSEDDTETGIAGLYAYDNPNRGIANSVVIPTVRPDGTPMTVKPNYCGSMNVIRGSASDSGLNGSLTVGKNFYNNGVNMTILKGGASEYNWKFVVAKSTDYFAECYNAEISNSVMTNISKVISASQSTDGGNNTSGDRGKSFGWDFTAPEIKTARTVYDDTIMLEFTEPVWNLNNQLVNTLSTLTFDNSSGAPKTFVKIFTDKELTNELQDGEMFSTIYVQTTEANRWNTDATGTSSGYAESTDRGRTGVSPKHRDVIVDLEISKATDTLYKTFIDGGGNRIKHYKNTERFTATTDQCKPVLVAAYTGQELHKNYNKSTGVTSQEPFDGHNFIELQYSEPVKFGNLPIESEKSDFSDINNLAAQGTFLSNAYHGGKISKDSDGLKITGYGSIQNGTVNAYKLTYENGSVSAEENGNVHSLYRKFSTDATVAADVQKSRVRFGIAAFATTDTFNGNQMYAWNSYIVDCVTPSGTFTPETNKFVQDAKGNQLDATGDSANGHELPQIVLNKNDVLCNATIDSDKTLYGKWDTSRPVFAMNFKTNMPWTEGSTRYNQSGEEFECIPAAATSGSSYLDRVEFHFFDNTPTYASTEEYKWVSENGWVSNSTGTVESGNYAGDISGGIRPKNKFGTDSNATGGGVRRSSLKNVSSAFSYIAGDATSAKSFSNKDAVQSVRSDYFIYADSVKANSIDENDSLYLGLFLNDDDKNLSVNTTFKVYVEEKNCYITDLAGNLVICPGAGELNTIDKIAPKFSLTLAAVGKNKFFVMFSKKLDTSKVDINKIQDSFEFIKNTTNSRTDSPVLSDLEFVNGSGKFILENAKVTCLEFDLNRTVTLEDIKSTWVRVKKPTPTLDPGSGMETYPTEIYDKSANYMQYYDCHSLSDFAINSMEPTFAYTNVIETETVDETSAANVIQSFTGNNFNAEKLFADRDITMQVKINDGTAENTTTDSAVLYFDSNVTGSRADRFNGLTGLNLNVWLPINMASMVSNGNVPENPSGNFADKVNEQNSSLHQLVILKDQFGWNKKDVVEFLAAICDSTGTVYELDNDGDGTTEKIPLYALRLENENDITSLAMWQFALTGISKQRGGVSIMKNVVNPELGDEVTIEVTTKDGNLNVAVMTMDGNIIKYLEHGTVTAGTHYYKWNGKNKAGNSVARGIYFVRIFGQGIDETRKVMVVK